ncbi:MAG TPA: hypothetical protein VFK02_25210, partial [Kofleriaceae bacterium]|nr:hypothetical protein [Kofleriaceae bacterium]
MPVPGEPRHAARIGILLLVLAVVGGGLWWKRSRTSEPATSTVIQPQREPAVSTASRAAPVEPARLTIRVT